MVHRAPKDVVGVNVTYSKSDISDDLMFGECW